MTYDLDNMCCGRGLPSGEKLTDLSLQLNVVTILSIYTI